MPESLRDRVARVLYEAWVSERDYLEAAQFVRLSQGDRAIFYAQADALIAAGIVADMAGFEWGIRVGLPDAEVSPVGTFERVMLAKRARGNRDKDKVVRRATYKPGNWQEAPREAL